MKTTSPLRFPFLIGGIYSLAFGAIQSIPPLAERILGRPITDPAIESIWGATILGTSTLYFIAASNPKQYKQLTWGFLSIITIISIDGLVYLIQGGFTVSDIGLYLIVNTLLIAWLIIAYQRS